MLSVSFWRAALIAFFTTSFMILQIETRFVSIAVLVLTIAGAAVFSGVSTSNIAQLATELHLAGN